MKRIGCMQYGAESSRVGAGSHRQAITMGGERSGDGREDDRGNEQAMTMAEKERSKPTVKVLHLSSLNLK